MPATRRYNPARPEPEVLAAQVRQMLEPIFGRRIDPTAEAIALPEPRRPTPATRAELERAIEFAIDLLDQTDGDPDIELQCEDEGFDCDREPEVDEGRGLEWTMDQRLQPGTMAWARAVELA